MRVQASNKEDNYKREWDWAAVILRSDYCGP